MGESLDALDLLRDCFTYTHTHTHTRARASIHTHTRIHTHTHTRIHTHTHTTQAVSLTYLFVCHTRHTHRNENEAAHAEISALLWDSASDSEAAEQLRALASEKLLGWEEEVGRRGPLDPSRGGGQMGGASNGGARGKGDGKRSHASDEEY